MNASILRLALPSVLLAFAFPLASACGGSVGGGGLAQQDSGVVHTDSGASSCTDPQPVCCGIVNGCEAVVGQPTCEAVCGGVGPHVTCSHEWTCPNGAPDVACSDICVATGDGGQGMQGDASFEDSGQGTSDATVGGSFTCSNITCDSATEYCYISEGGAFQPDASNGGVNASCKPIPAACADDISCSCIGDSSLGGSCVDHSGQVTVTFAAP